MASPLAQGGGRRIHDKALAGITLEAACIDRDAVVAERRHDLLLLIGAHAAPRRARPPVASPAACHRGAARSDQASSRAPRSPAWSLLHDLKQRVTQCLGRACAVACDAAGAAGFAGRRGNLRGTIKQRAQDESAEQRPPCDRASLPCPGADPGFTAALILFIAQIVPRIRARSLSGAAAGFSCDRNHAIEIKKPLELSLTRNRPSLS